MFHSLPKLVINLDSVVHNFKYLSTLINPSELSAVVKANAYGIGVQQVSESLYKYADCKKFFVANIDEGIELRKLFSDYNIEIYVLHGVLKEEVTYFKEYNLIPVLNDFYQLMAWKSFIEEIGYNLPCSIQFDTGMNRLGFSSNDASKISEITTSMNIKYVISHLSFADNKNSDSNKFQLEEFQKISKYFPNVKKSLSSSPGIFLGKDYNFDLIRIGRGLLGPNFYANLPNDLKHVVSIYAPIIQIRTVESDGFVGYSATHRVKKGTKIATLPIGYADGYMRLFGNLGHVYFEGYKLPVIGKVSMDLITVDVTEIKDDYLQIGKYVEIIGKNVDFHSILVQAGTSSSELFTRLGSRYIKEYIEPKG